MVKGKSKRNQVIMREASFNLRDENGELWGQERWHWSDETDGYIIEIRYFLGMDERSFVEASQPNMSKKRELMSWVV